jgi:hypothetical protein
VGLARYLSQWARGRRLRSVGRYWLTLDRRLTGPKKIVAVPHPSGS